MEASRDPEASRFQRHSPEQSSAWQCLQNNPTKWSRGKECSRGTLEPAPTGAHESYWIFQILWATWYQVDNLKFLMELTPQKSPNLPLLHIKIFFFSESQLLLTSMYHPLPSSNKEALRRSGLHIDTCALTQSQTREGTVGPEERRHCPKP